MEYRRYRRIVGLSKTHWNIYPCTVAPPRILLFVFFAQPLSIVRILFRLRRFARSASRKTELGKNNLFAMSALRNTSVFGDSPVNFTTKLTVVDFPSADWLSYLRTQLKAFVAEFAMLGIFLSALFSKKLFRLKQTL